MPSPSRSSSGPAPSRRAASSCHRTRSCRPRRESRRPPFRFIEQLLAAPLAWSGERPGLAGAIDRPAFPGVDRADARAGVVVVMDNVPARARGGAACGLLDHYRQAPDLQALSAPFAQDRLHVVAGGSRMLARQMLGTGGVAVGDGVDDGPVLRLGDIERPLTRRDVDAVRQDRRGRGERLSRDPVELARDDAAAREGRRARDGTGRWPRNSRRSRSLPALIDQNRHRVRRRSREALPLQSRGIGAPLGGEPGRGALQDPAQLDGVDDVLGQEGPTRKPPLFTRSSRPSSARRDIASRTGVRDISSASASGISSKRVPPGQLAAENATYAVRSWPRMAWV